MVTSTGGAGSIYRRPTRSAVRMARDSSALRRDARLWAPVGDPQAYIPHRRRIWQLKGLGFLLSNPDAARILEIVADYVIGEKVELQMKKEWASRAGNAARITDTHFADPLSRWGKAHGRVVEQGVYGEMLIEMKDLAGASLVLPADQGFGGALVASDVNPLDVLESLPLEANRNILAAVKVRQSTNEERWLRVVTPSPWLGRLPTMGELRAETNPQTGRPYDGFALHDPINTIAGIPNGIPDLVRIMDYLEMTETLLFQFAEGSLFRNAHVYDIEVDTDDEEVLDEVEAEFKAGPKPGQVYVHTPGVKITPVVPQLGAAEHDVAITLLRKFCAAGAGLALYFLGEGEDVNYSTSRNMAKPIRRRLIARQGQVMSAFSNAALFQATVAAEVNKEPLPGLNDVKVTGPEIGEEEVLELVDRLGSLASTLTLAKDNLNVTPESAGKAFVDQARRAGMVLEIKAASAPETQAAPTGPAFEDAVGFYAETAFRRPEEPKTAAA